MSSLAIPSSLKSLTLSVRGSDESRAACEMCRNMSDVQVQSSDKISPTEESKTTCSICLLLIKSGSAPSLLVQITACDFRKAFARLLLSPVQTRL